jgi:hypothetical protein
MNSPSQTTQILAEFGNSILDIEDLDRIERIDPGSAKEVRQSLDLVMGQRRVSAQYLAKLFFRIHRYKSS